MEIKYLPQADADLNYWIKTGNKANLKKIAQLTRAIIENPYSGIGKPEALNMTSLPNGLAELMENTDMCML